eukprot:CAMPEP_0180544242 /NCGR_PEP_ID=MMETSP1036_2-20121128/69416_1 /TAXON_ID=632150 /ORGANISM="Azadinium spinosum, Strain 3D9" /LENGTH=49 /DNA_ID=CAMNT_0022559233 /DNA_START=15 /DNA_END=164 /DNA_ORIENTATION=+
MSQYIHLLRLNQGFAMNTSMLLGGMQHRDLLERTRLIMEERGPRAWVSS